MAPLFHDQVDEALVDALLNAFDGGNADRIIGAEWVHGAFVRACGEEAALDPDAVQHARHVKRREHHAD